MTLQLFNLGRNSAAFFGSQLLGTTPQRGIREPLRGVQVRKQLCVAAMWGGPQKSIQNSFLDVSPQLISLECYNIEVLEY